MNPRTVTVAILMELFIEKTSLGKILKAHTHNVPGKQKAFVQELSFGVARLYPRLVYFTNCLLQKPFKPKDQDIYILILIGIYQLLYMRKPPHAVISETVEVARELKKEWACGVVNAILRNVLRSHVRLNESLHEKPSAFFAHPDWMLKMFQQAWPNDWKSIVDANNRKPPLSLRVNKQKISRDVYFEKLKEKNIGAKSNLFCQAEITLEQACDVIDIPGFSEGEITVQDCSAQLAAELMDLKPRQRVLDACAAPGGKTTHILELEPALSELVALDNQEGRLVLLKENLNRLHLNATLICADALKPAQWWNSEKFDRILLDVPCSATGVIRRHPDIKLLRRSSDIARLAEEQLQFLKILWPLLKEGGKLLYTTCSILPDENYKVVKQFLEIAKDAREIPICAEWGVNVPCGRQILTGQHDMDGFYYARIEKTIK